MICVSIASLPTAIVLKHYLIIIHVCYLSVFRTRNPEVMFKWWMRLRGLLRILAHHEDVYEFTHAKLVHLAEFDKEDHDITS